jgi:hypothetical protein
VVIAVAAVVECSMTFPTGQLKVIEETEAASEVAVVVAEGAVAATLTKVLRFSRK